MKKGVEEKEKGSEQLCKKKESREFEPEMEGDDIYNSIVNQNRALSDGRRQCKGNVTSK